MKVSRLIRILQDKQKFHGDLPVRMLGPFEVDVDVEDVHVYDKDGNSPQGGNLAVEIYLHMVADGDHVGN